MNRTLAAYSTTFALIFGLTSVAFANTAKQSEQELAIPQERIQISTRSPLVGLWGMDIPNNKKCVEYYNFKSNSELYVRSGKEWSTGQYDYQIASERSDLLSGLILQIKYDNNEMDCSGHQVDQSGEISQYYVKWKNPNQIQFCASEAGEQCFATLRRVLP